MSAERNRAPSISENAVRERIPSSFSEMITDALYDGEKLVKRD
jgi:hypothetical protein